MDWPRINLTYTQGVCALWLHGHSTGQPNTSDTGRKEMGVWPHRVSRRFKVRLTVDPAVHTALLDGWTSLQHM